MDPLLNARYCAREHRRVLVSSAGLAHRSSSLRRNITSSIKKFTFCGCLLILTTVYHVTMFTCIMIIVFYLVFH